MNLEKVMGYFVKHLFILNFIPFQKHFAIFFHLSLETLDSWVTLYCGLKKKDNMKAANKQFHILMCFVM